MRKFARAGSAVGNEMFSGSVRGAWLRVIAVAAAATMIVFTLVIADSHADPAPFAPTVTLDTSTTLAAAHPDARVTITNPGTEDLKSVQLDLPDGMWGSLAAVPNLCSWANASAGTCPASSKVGTIVADATIDQSDARLRGSVFLTDPDPLSAHANDGPAWMSIVLPAKVGGVDFGKVITPGRVELRHNQTGVPTNVAGPIYGPVNGVRATVDDIPKSITDDNSARTLTFHLKKMQIDLRSNQTAPEMPLLTNPSKCSTASLDTKMTSYDSATIATPSASYTTVGCSSLKVRPVQTTFSLSDSAAGNATNLSSTIEFPATTGSTRNPTLTSTKLILPPGLGPNSGEFGGSSLKCSSSGSNIRKPSGSSPSLQPFFRTPSITWSSGNCPANAKIGTATIWTPLLKDPVVGNVWAVDQSPVPNIAIDVNPSISGNPKGVYLTLIGETAAAGFSAIDGLGTSVTADFGALPDAPVTKIKVDLAGSPVNGPTGSMLVVAAPDVPGCQPDIDYGTVFKSQSGASGDGWSVGTSSLTGCDPIPAGVTGPVGGQTASTNPSFSVTNSNLVGECTFRPLPVEANNCPPGTTVVSPVAALSNGLHALQISTANDVFTNFPADRKDMYRYFAVDSTPAGDTTAPTTTITASPSDPTSDTTPDFSFSSDESSLFECSLDSGAFLPCNNSAAATSGSSTLMDPLIVNDDLHTYAVRARDAAGNVDATPDSVSFHVAVAFDPTFAVSLSTSAARAHPTMDVTITSGSHEDLKDLELNLPDGFLGGLSSVPTLCPATTAATGGCTSASEVGTVDAEALVDESTIRLPGKVYLTTPITVGDPAGLAVDIPAKIQSVDQGHVVVPIRLTVRGQVQGINSKATNIPTGIDPTNGLDTHSDFDMRSIVLKLRDNPSASQPLLTNPSQCGASTFAAKFTGSNLPTPTTVSRSVGFQATNCDALGFSPQLGISLTDINGNPPASRLDSDNNVMRLTAHLAANPGDAGIKNIDLLFPKPVTINVSQLPPSCSVPQYNAGGAEACPAASKIGTAVANSPLLREKLEGSIYLLSSDKNGLPRVLVALRGAINTDVIGRNSFVDGNQVHSVFDTLPDVPLSTFDLSLTSLITARDEVCESDKAKWVVTGTMGAFNGSAAAVVNPLAFTCKGSGTAKFKNKGAKSTLKMEVKAPGGSTLKSVSVKLPSGMKFIKKGLKKKAVINGGNNEAEKLKFKTKCVKYKGTNKFSVDTCKRAAYTVNAKFSAGSLSASKKVKRPKISVTTVDALGRKTTFTIVAK